MFTEGKSCNGNHIQSHSTHDVSIPAGGLDCPAQGGLSRAGEAPQHDEEWVGGRVLGPGLQGVDVVVGVEQEAVPKQASIGQIEMSLQSDKIPTYLSN